MSQDSTARARDVAECIINRTARRSMGFAKLHALLYYVQCWSMAWDGRPIFREPVLAKREGPRVETIDARWYRQTMRRARTAKRRFRALESRVFTWATRMHARRRCNPFFMNVPGGWSEFDAAAQRAGLALAGLGPLP